MKKKYNKAARYSVLKTVLRIITLGIALTALMLAVENRQEIRWMDKVQENVIEKVLFQNVE